jgi:ligand-binding SRPBCC domain-containing protein
LGITTSSIVAFPIDEVFAWHERPGALPRLIPPWQPIRVRREPADLRDGRAELLLPGGLVWVAQHSDYAPPYRFVDRLTSLPLPWRHVHTFEAVDEAGTRVVDDVVTPIPEALLRTAFTYRHRQLADDLAVAAEARGRGAEVLTVAMTGASGLVGRNLTALLGVCGHRVIRLVRRAAAGPDERHWDPDNPELSLLDGVDALIHLAGAPIGGRFTAEHKRAVYGSRVPPTRRLAEIVARRVDRLKAFVCASAIGYYGADRRDEVLDERSERGDGFVADVVADWEAATSAAIDAGVRTVLLRTGIAQSPRGGVLRMLTALHRRARRPARRRAAVDVVDRPRRPVRRLFARPVGHRDGRTSQRDRPDAGPQQRLHEDPRRRASPPPRAPGPDYRAATAGGTGRC